jgi:hypothetical protein
MIRLATRSDIAQITQVLMEFMRESTYSEYVEEANPQYLNRLVFNVIYVGYIWLWLVKDESGQEKIAGLLAAVREPNVWQPKSIQLRELAWYVRPEYRGLPTGGRLFVEYCRKGDELMQAGQIRTYAIMKMANTPAVDLERRGFRLTEHVFLKE